MILMDFISSLLPRLNTSDILEDIAATKAEIATVVRPCYDAAKDVFKVNRFKSEEVEGLVTAFYRNYDLATSKKQSNFIAEIQSRLGDLYTNLEFIEKQVDELFERDIIREGLTAKKAVLVRSAEQISYVSRYCTDLLTLVYSLEAKAISKTELTGVDINAATAANITKNIGNFARLLSANAIKPEDYKAKIGTIPEVVVNDKTHQALNAVYKESNIDPLGSPVISRFDYNPVYFFGRLIAEWQANRYKASKEKKKSLELRLLHLQMLQENSDDPKLEQEISYIQGRIDDLDYKIKKMEDSVS